MSYFVLWGKKIPYNFMVKAMGFRLKFSCKNQSIDHGQDDASLLAALTAAEAIRALFQFETPVPCGSHGRDEVFPRCFQVFSFFLFFGGCYICL